MLAYYFPPLAGGGVQRTLKFVKYLPEHGFDPIVVTVRAVAQPLHDPSLVQDVPARATVLRAPEVPLYLGKWAIDSALRQAGLPRRLAAALYWPDELVGWVPGALVSALRAVRRHRPDAVYSSSSPVSAHLVALLVSRLARLPWVADFRDAWTLNPGPSRGFGPLNAALERRIVRSAGRLVVADDSIELLGVPADDPRRVVISNGVDADDVEPIRGSGRGAHGRFRLTHVGMLYGQRTAEPLLAALDALIARGVLDADRVELRLVGDASARLESRAGAVDVTRIGYVDHRRAVAEMRAADVLVLLQPPGWDNATGKIYEYLATGRPILCVAPDGGQAARHVRDLGAGACVDPGDAPGIEEAVSSLYAAWSQGSLGASERVREDALARFSRRALTGELARVLEAACRGDGRSAYRRA